MRCLPLLLSLVVVAPNAAQDLPGCCPEPYTPVLVGGLDSLQARVVYPPEAADDRVEGRVIVKLLVGPTGEVSNLETVRSADPRLNAEALRVASTAVFEWPEGTPERWKRTWFAVPIVFSLSP